jgi:hypothetical protein
MTRERSARAQLDETVDAIEAGYEFLLAYAAQGRHTDRGGGSGPEVRVHLGNMEAALAVLADRVRACAAATKPALVDAGGAFFDAIGTDAAIARAAVKLVLAHDDIGSQLIDNLNASIHLRAVLTDIFLIDEALSAKKPT